MILHVDMDAFFAAIEERDNPHLRGKAIVVGADPKNGYGRGVVSTANYEARKYGIHSAMPISVAYRVNLNAVFLPVDMVRYKRVSEAIMRILRKYAVYFEPVSSDEAYLQPNLKFKIKNSKLEYQEAERIAEKIKKDIWNQVKLTCSIGIGPNKLIAKIASDHQKPDGLTIVETSEVQGFLDPKPATVLPGIGPKTYAVLHQKWGIKTVFDLRQVPKETLIEVFGKNGKWIFEIARGIDRRPVEEEHEIKSVGRQTTFETDTNNSQLIISAIFELLEETFQELKEQMLKGNTLTVIVRYAGFETHTSQETIIKELNFEKAKNLSLKLLLPYLGKNRKIRLVGVRISGFGQK
ncbi:MAG: DNA polymerase IV [Candidatus Levybacteria bacterium]|nr:DNA polymerase IV [Candidatus Levybacteria bacterium]